MRNPFGVICGKYCEAAVLLHFCLYCEDRSQIEEAQKKSAELIKSVYDAYMELFGRLENPVPHLWDKISGLLFVVHEKLPEQWQEKKLLENIAPSEFPENVELFTALH